MKVRTSPVFYFGILLVLAVAGLLAAPYVIDWNNYRADLEAYGKKLSGRNVTIGGGVAVRLFPWPRLTAEKVSIANPPGLADPEFATADRIVVRITLAGLIRGGLDVESIDIENPVIHLERQAAGEGNWRFLPSADLIRSDLLSRVKLDQIRLTGGTIAYRDRRRGETLRLDDVNANVASPGIQGPWRLRGLALYDDRAFDLSVNTGIYEKDQPFRFGLKLAPADNSGLVFSFDGAQNRDFTEGVVRIEPAAAGDGKSDAEGRLRPLALTAKVKADFDTISLSDMALSPLDPAQGGPITTGAAQIKFGQHIAAKVELSASMLDLDELAGAKSRDLMREAGSLALANSVLGLLPADMNLSGSLKVTAFKAGGETFDNVTLALDAGHDALRISEFSTGLPGRSQMLFRGVFFPGEASAELSGSLALETNDLRALSFWAWPEGRSRLEPLWTGSRGRFKMQAEVSATAGRFRLSSAQYQLDGELGTGELSITAAGRGAVDLRLDGSRFDLDAYAPQGIPAFSAAAAQGIGGLAALALPHADAPDLRLKITAQELLLNAVTASNVSIDLESGINGLNLRGLEIGSVGGARLSAMGLVLDSGEGADGSIGVEVKAGDPGELLRLAGLVKGDALPPWAQGLGPTALSGDIGVKPAEGGARVSFGLDGTAGELTLSANGAIAPDMTLTTAAKVSAPHSSRIMALLGLTPADGGTDPGALQLQASGSLKDGFTVNAAIQAFGARLDYQGSAIPAAPGFAAGGKIALRSTDAGALLRASGLPLREIPEGVLVADAAVASAGGRWSFPDISGRLGSASFSGKATFDPAAGIEAHLETGALDLSDVLAATFLDWSGTAPDLETGFASHLPFGLTGEVWIKPSLLAVHSHFAARDAEIGITAKAGEVRLAMFGKDEQGRDAQIELSSSGSGTLRQIEGRVAIPVNLARQLALVNGAPVAEGSGQFDVSFHSSGRSPGGALASLSGSGSYTIAGLRLLGLSPGPFNTALGKAKDAPGITAAFDALRGGTGLDIGNVTGSITVTDGEAAFLPFSAKTPDADVTVKTMAELALGEIDTEITLSLKAREALPAMSVAYAGPPMALARSEDNTELATKLGVTIMRQGIDELERLQQEQKRLAAEEEQQRIADEARLAAYYAQRDELLLRKRELKVHAEMVVAEADRLRRQIESERAANAEINKSEIKQRQREIRLYRRLARAAVQQKPAVQPPPRPQPEPSPAGPVILVKPPGAPAVISPEPGISPTQ